MNPRCKACSGRGTRLHGWAVCPRACEDCDGTGVFPVTQHDFEELADLVALNARMQKIRALIREAEAARFERAVLADIAALPVVGDAA